MKLPNGELAEIHSRLYMKDNEFPFYDECGIFIEKKDGFSIPVKGKDFW